MQREIAATCLHVQTCRYDSPKLGPNQPSNPIPTPINRYDVPFTHNDKLKQLDRYDKLLTFIVACKPALRVTLHELVTIDSHFLMTQICTGAARDHCGDSPPVW